MVVSGDWMRYVKTHHLFLQEWQLVSDGCRQTFDQASRMFGSYLVLKRKLSCNQALSYFREWLHGTVMTWNKYLILQQQSNSDAVEIRLMAMLVWILKFFHFMDVKQACFALGRMQHWVSSCPKWNVMQIWSDSSLVVFLAERNMMNWYQIM